MWCCTAWREPPAWASGGSRWGEAISVPAEVLQSCLMTAVEASGQKSAELPSSIVTPRRQGLHPSRRIDQRSTDPFAQRTVSGRLQTRPGATPRPRSKAGVRHRLVWTQRQRRYAIGGRPEFVSLPRSQGIRESLFHRPMHAVQSHGLTSNTRFLPPLGSRRR